MIVRARFVCSSCVMLAAFLCGSGVWIHTAWAQAVVPPAAVTGTADPGRIEKRNIPDSRTWQQLERQGPDQQVVPQIPDGASEMRFILNSVTVDGMTAYTPDDVRDLWQAYAGQTISVADLFTIMAALQEKYLRDGYTLTRVYIPNQNIEGGDARLEVVEGYVGMVELEPGLEEGRIISDLRRRVLAMRPLNTIALERLLLIANDIPGLNVSAILASMPEGTPAPGAVRMVLQQNGETTPTARVAIDNYGSKFAGPWQGRGSVTFPDTGFDYGALTLDAVAALSLPEQKFAAARYAVPLYGVSGLNLAVSGTIARTEPGSTLDVLDVRGRSKSMSVELSWAAIRQRSRTLTLNLEFEVKNSETDLLGEELYDDRQRILSAGLNYGFADAWRGYNLFDVHVVKGLDVLGMNPRGGAAALSRADGRPDFTRVNFAAGRLQALPADLQLYGMLAGQYSGVPLLSSEEFGFGGDQMGRGYNPSELAGDKAIALTLELRHSMSGAVMDRGYTLQPYVFYDIGKVWNIDNNDTTHMSAASAGVGLRFSIDNQWDGNAALAFPLTRSADNPPKYSDEYGPRILFSLSRSF